MEVLGRQQEPLEPPPALLNIQELKGALDKSRAGAPTREHHPLKLEPTEMEPAEESHHMLLGWEEPLQASLPRELGAKREQRVCTPTHSHLSLPFMRKFSSLGSA